MERLASFGKELIVEMNNVGMMIDIFMFLMMLLACLIFQNPCDASHSLRHFTPLENVSDEC